ncbi:hypothetical protein AMEX_G26226 [Astyanax mexicanus]|uniref:Uncharacterized protein n=1 Tax=Astyanax mexicanus TaxID=7994 RepID=A0A8T2KPG2_ASTMX|nr:hypothetical protein AMEX_G26226 [Astyanax mexicanus]
MAQRELSELKYSMMVFGDPLNSHQTFMDQLGQRLSVVEESSIVRSDVIIAFVAGTDIKAALQEIPQEGSKPIVLVVLHHTTEKDSMNLNRRSVNRQQVFIVDCLFYGDQGFLTCQSNDKALKAVTLHLVALGASERSMPKDTIGLFQSVLHFFVKILGGFLVAVGFDFVIHLFRRRR